MTPGRRRAVLWLALLALSLAGCSDRASGTPAKTAAPAVAAVPVAVAEVVQRDAPVQVTAVGNVQGLTTVAVKSQIAGQIVQAHFKEGQEVRRGELLFTIDPRPLEAALRQAQANVTRDTAGLRQAEAALGQRRAEVQQAEANLARDIAQMDNARVQEQRYRELVDRELIAREQYDQIRTNSAAMDATVRADRAAVDNARASALAAQAAVDNARAVILADEAMVDNARLQLGYTTIRAPMDGRTGSILVQSGNVVKGNDDGPLVVITQVHPIYVSFAVPEQYLPDIKRYRAAGPLRVEAYPERTKPPARGEVTFVNSTVDATTGTIQLKGTFANADNALWPGQFLDVVLTLTTQPNAIVVPTPAIQAGQQGSFVFVVKPDLTVESRKVEPGRRLERETIIDKGLAAGERIVTDGQLRLRPGTKVEVKKAS
jgi:membrane fusion protein, multidrug efflux system